MSRRPATLGAAIVAVVVLPGLLAVAVPLAITYVESDPPIHWWGPLVAAVGIMVLARTVHAFYSFGRGTLAPWDPPRRLVTIGPYRYCRNPMYLGVLTIVAGWAVTTGSATLGVYVCILFIAFHLRVVLAEEPWAARTFTDEWDAYRRQVARWLPHPRLRTHDDRAGPASSS